jgi:hypothetical protein
VAFLRSPFKCLAISSSCAVNIFPSTFVYIHHCLVNFQLCHTVRMTDIIVQHTMNNQKSVMK